MRAFKAFNKDMTCNRGRGSFQYRENTTYREDKAQAHETGFHCAEFILDCFRYYPAHKDTIVCPVEALGDIDEDGSDTKISCTVMQIGRRLTVEEIVFEAMKYIVRHPKYTSKDIESNNAIGRGLYCIVRGKDPRAAGAEGTVLGLIKEKKRSKEVEAIAVYTVGKGGIRQGRYYDINGEEVANEEG